VTSSYVLGGGGGILWEYQYQESVVVNGGEAEDLERIWNKVMMSQSMYYPGICLEDL
jgi:hypothetical protein